PEPSTSGRKRRAARQGTRLPASRNSGRPPSSSRLPASWQNQSSSNNPAFSQMQELRKLSNSSIPATAPPRRGTMGRQTQWKKYLLIGGVGGLVLITTIVVLSNQSGAVQENFW